MSESEGTGMEGLVVRGIGIVMNSALRPTFLEDHKCLVLAFMSYSGRSV